MPLGALRERTEFGAFSLITVGRLRSMATVRFFDSSG